jgi:hypothetical protein
MGDTLPATARRAVAAVQALALADVLGLGLPAPHYCGLFADGGVMVQFAGPSRLSDLSAWASRFGAPVVHGRDFARARFTHMGVRFDPYALVTEPVP